VLFLDEPTSGVDPLGRRTIWDLLFSLSREHGVAILVTTHYMSEAEHCDRLALMHAGDVIANAAPAELKRQLRSDAGQLIEIATPNLDQAMSLLRSSGYEPTAYGTRIHIFSHDLNQDDRRISELLPGSTRKQIDLSMEDVFVYRVTQLEERKSLGRAA